jgi:cell filamentation protein
MMIENKLGIKNSVELAIIEEKTTKKKALEIYKNKLFFSSNIGTYENLKQIHKYLFSEIYDFAGELRKVNISKNNFRFAPVLYLEQSLEAINNMPQNTFEQIIEKYVEMNVAHPFREGNGRATRIWLDLLMRKQLNKAIDWSKIDTEEYLMAMQRSPFKDLEIKELISSALTAKLDDAEIYMKGIDRSYEYEGYSDFTINEINNEQ